MKVVIDKTLAHQDREKLLKKVQPKMKGLDVKKFAGKISWKGNPLKIQREMRDE
jgi:hypothetical protein